MRTCFLWSIGMLLCLGGVGAAQEQSVGPAAFDYTLDKLNQSMADLSRENETINDQNKVLRASNKVLTGQLTALQAEGRRLEEKKAALAARQRRGAAGGALKAQLARMDQELKKIGDASADVDTQMRAVEQEESSLRQQADALESDLAGTGSDGVLSYDWQQSVTALQAQRDKLQKDLDAVCDQFQTARNKWVDLDTSIRKGPEQWEGVKAEQALLLKEAAAVEAELPRIKAQLAATQAELDRLGTEDHSDLRVARIESEVKSLAERNRAVDIEALTLQKAREEKIKRLQEARASAQVQYQGKINELSTRNAALRQELDGLRKQMVSLDKKKSVLEASAYGGR